MYSPGSKRSLEIPVPEEEKAWRSIDYVFENEVQGIPEEQEAAEKQDFSKDSPKGRITKREGRLAVHRRIRHQTKNVAYRESVEGRLLGRVTQVLAVNLSEAEAEEDTRAGVSYEQPEPPKPNVEVCHRTARLLHIAWYLCRRGIF